MDFKMKKKKTQIRLHFADVNVAFHGVIGSLGSRTTTPFEVSGRPFMK